MSNNFVTLMPESNIYKRFYKYYGAPHQKIGNIVFNTRQGAAHRKSL